MSLASMQRVLAELLREPRSLVDAAASSPPAEHADAARAIAAGNDRLSPVEQVDIYREQFFLRHVDSLRDDFRSLEHLLGAEGFVALAKAYLAAHPPRTFNLRDAGHALPRFVTEQAPWMDDALVSDLAKTEWAFIEAFDGPDAPPLDLAQVATVKEDEWPGARLVVHPSAQLLALSFPSTDYRVAARKDEHPVRPEPKPSHVVVYRGKEVLHYMDVEPDAFALLRELAAGAPLGEACERAATTSGTAASDFETKLGTWFSHWTQLGWIVRVEL
jgi:Putative DNA-binding domain